MLAATLLSWNSTIHTFINRPMDQVPQFLYKYRPVNALTLRTISHSEMYFALPRDFNDPFDCNIAPEPIYTREEAEEYIKQIRTVDPEGHFEKAYEVFRTDGMQRFYDILSQDIQRMRDRVRICSLSEIPNSVIMFSHYADSHQGICLELRSHDTDFFDALTPVDYPDAFPTFYPFRGDRRQQILVAEFLTKSKEWAYEREWRIIKASPKPAIYHIPEGSLTSIIFGCHTPDEDKELVRSANRSRNTPAQLKEAYKLEKSFALGIRTVDL